MDPVKSNPNTNEHNKVTRLPPTFRETDRCSAQSWTEHLLCSRSDRPLTGLSSLHSDQIRTLGATSKNVTWRSSILISATSPRANLRWGWFLRTVLFIVDNEVPSSRHRLLSREIQLKNLVLQEKPIELVRFFRDRGHPWDTSPSSGVVEIGGGFWFIYAAFFRFPGYRGSTTDVVSRSFDSSNRSVCDGKFSVRLIILRCNMAA